MDSAKTIVSIIACAALCLTIVFSGLANVGSVQGIKPDENLFPNEFALKDVLIAPVSQIYGTWVFVYIYQVCWLCFALYLVFKSSVSDLLDKKCFGAYGLALLSNIVWLFIWSRQMYGLGFVFHALQAIFLNTSLYFALSSSHDYFQPSPPSVLSTIDFWCFRLLVVNGISFFTGWVSVTALVNFAGVLQHDLDASPIEASNAALSLMLICVVVWSALQNFVWERHTRLMFAEYIPVVVVLAGIIAKNWNYEHEKVRSFSLVLFIITFMLAIFRIGLVIKGEAKRGAFPLAQQEPGENVKLI